jgi:CysZ protein
MISNLLGGAALLVRGFGLVAGRRRLFLLGALPALITSVIFLALLITMISNLDRIIPQFATWIRILIGIGAVGGSVLIMVLVFTAITLAIGSPAYDKISELVETELGDAPDEAAEPVVRSIGRSVGQSIVLTLVSLGGAIVLALLGLIPVVGQSVITVLSTIFGSWMLCIQLLGTPFQRRGIRTVAERRQAMRAQRVHTLGFAVPTFLLLAIPFVSVLVFPAAAAGATMLARDLLGERRRT